MKNNKQLISYLGVDPEKDLNFFCVQDSFNPENTLEGYISLRPDYRYGSLNITKINDQEVDIVVFGTPKLHYPFDKNGQYHWPKIGELQVYEKIDGTNILAFRYEYKGKKFTTFKTRLTPVLKNMKFGSFFDLWNEVIQKETWLMPFLDKYLDTYNLSFELYGNRNPLTIKYNVDISTKFLFAINKNTADIKPPIEIISNNDKCIVPNNYIITSKHDLTNLYNNLRQEAGDINKEELLTEGWVLYIFDQEDLKWKMFKCKPEQIEKIHWQYTSISRSSIWTTAINCFESIENPTVDDVKQLLKEEFTDQQIGRSEIRIQKIFSEAREHVRFVSNVNSIYYKLLRDGLDIRKNKNEVLKFMSKYFGKYEMRKVASIILNSSLK